MTSLLQDGCPSSKHQVLREHPKAGSRERCRAGFPLYISSHVTYLPFPGGQNLSPNPPGDISNLVPCMSLARPDSQGRSWPEDHFLPDEWLHQVPITWARTRTLPPPHPSFLLHTPSFFPPVLAPGPCLQPTDQEEWVFFLLFSFFFFFFSASPVAYVVPGLGVY